MEGSQGPYKALKGHIRPLKGLYKAIKVLRRRLRALEGLYGPYKARKSLIEPLNGLVNDAAATCDVLAPQGLFV